MKTYYGPFPFWTWNGDLRDDELIRQMKAMRSQGIAEFMICPTSGMEVDYPSTVYFRKVRLACETAHTLGMGVWLYDDLNWPSGCAGGTISARYPEFRMRGLRCCRKCFPADSNRRVELEFEDGEVLLALLETARGTSDLREVVGRWRIRKRPGRSSTYSRLCFPSASYYRHGALTLPPGECRLLFAVVTVTKYLPTSAIGLRWSANAEGYVDTLNPRAAATFIHLTHDQYARHVGRFFGNVIRGIFTDEPSMIRMHRAPAGWDSVHDLAWTGMLPGIFARNRGYDLMKAIPGIISADATAEVAGWRRDFRTETTALYQKAYHQAIRRWCDEHRLRYIGHILNDKTPSSWVAAQGDYLRVMEHFHIPAMDHVWSRPSLGSAREYGWKVYEFVTAKAIMSLGERLNAERVCCETFALGGFGATLGDFRATTDFLAALGINQTLVSAFFYSLRGNRRRIVPSAHTYQSPLWPHYRVYADYVARLSRLMAQSRHAAGNLLVATVADSHSVPNSFTWGACLSATVHSLLSAHLDFALLHEHWLEKARLSGKTLRIGRRSYATVLVPAHSYLPPKTVERLAGFQANGGRLIHLGPEGRGDLRAAQRTVSVKYADGSDTPAIVGERQLGQDPLLIVTLLPETEARDGWIEIRQRGWPVLVNLETDKRERLFCRRTTRGVRIPVRFAPGRAILILMAAKPPCGCRRMDLHWESAMSLDGPWQYELLKPNAAYPERWRILDGRHWRNAAGERLYLDYACERTRRIRAEFHLEFVPDVLALCFEAGVIQKIRVNGSLAPGRPKPSPTFDESTRELDIRRLARHGCNQVEAFFTVPEYERRINYYGDPKLPPFFLVGNFAVGAKGLRPKPAALISGSWTTQGFPRYSGTIRYAKNFLWQPRASIRGDPVIFNADVHGGVMAVTVNGKRAGCRAWAPYQLDVDALLRAGENRIEIEATNTLANILETPLPSGLASAGLGVMR